MFGLEPPRAATLLRKALNYGSILHSHAVHFFALAAPDLMLGINAPAADRNIVALLKSAPEVAKGALRLRSIGQKVTEVIGGRGTHPVAAVAGGMAAPLSAERHEALARLTAEALPLACTLVETAREALTKRTDLIQSLPLPTAYLGTVQGGELDLYDGMLRLRTIDGADVEFGEDDWASRLSEETVGGSYSKPVTCKDGKGEPVSYRVGALARLNCCEKAGTPRADAELQLFRQLGGNPCHQTAMYHHARLIELLHAAEALATLVADPEIRSDNVRATGGGTPRRAAAHVEAPRGLLIHDYDVDANGIVTSANLLVATQQNTSSINETVKMSAARYLDQPDDMLLNGIEFGIRCYDPCLSCATHRLGDMKLDVVVRERGEIVRRVRR